MDEERWGDPVGRSAVDPLGSGATSALSVLARALGLHHTGAALVLRNELKAAGEGR